MELNTNSGNALFERELDDARQALVALERDLLPLARRRQQLRQKVELLERLLAVEKGGAPPAAAPPAAARIGAPDRPRSFLDAAYEIVRTEGEQGLYYRDLFNKLVEQGFRIPGQDPAQNLIAHLSRDPRFVRNPDRGRGHYRAAEFAAESEASS